MSKHLSPSDRAGLLRSSVFAVLARCLQGYTGKRYPLHVGDNCVAPPDGAQWPTADVTAFGDPYRYGHPHGELLLRERLAEKICVQNGMPSATADNIQITVGATGAMNIILTSLLDAGDEILVLSPYWPLLRGIAHSTGVVPTEVPFYQELLDRPDVDPAEILAPHVGPKTRMIYLITPNNPNGLVLSRAQLESIAAFAKSRDLWVLSDEAYESYAYDAPHISIGSMDDMFERTISVYTFSKTYAMAGVRLGYVVAPTDAMGYMRRVATHLVYNTSQFSQAMALGALSDGDSFIQQTRSRYQDASSMVTTNLNASFHRAQGGAYVYLDLREYGADSMPILERAAEHGITLAPGVIFGAGFEGFARLCYTAIDHGDLSEAIDLFNGVLGRS